MTRRRRWNRPFPEPVLAALFWLSVVLVLDGTGLVRISFWCALLHECGHITAYRLLQRGWPRLKISPFGICLSMRGVFLSADRELILASAGPMVNLSLSGAGILWMRYLSGYSWRGYWFASINLLVGCSNLLPLPGLDGARILRCLWESARDGLHSDQK